MTADTSSTSQPLRLGFIGLGIMGAPMAGHLVAAGGTRLDELLAGDVTQTGGGPVEHVDVVTVGIVGDGGGGHHDHPVGGRHHDFDRARIAEAIVRHQLHDPSAAAAGNTEGSG